MKKLIDKDLINQAVEILSRESIPLKIFFLVPTPGEMPIMI